MINIFGDVMQDIEGQEIFGGVFTVPSAEDTPTPQADDRVVVSNQALDTFGVQGTVKLVDRHDKVWVRLDGYGARQYLPFDVTDITAVQQESEFVYGCEPTRNSYVQQQECIS